MRRAGAEVVRGRQGRRGLGGEARGGQRRRRAGQAAGTAAGVQPRQRNPIPPPPQQRSHTHIHMRTGALGRRLCLGCRPEQLVQAGERLDQCLAGGTLQPHIAQHHCGGRQEGRTWGGERAGWCEAAEEATAGSGQVGRAKERCRQGGEEQPRSGQARGGTRVAGGAASAVEGVPPLVGRAAAAAAGRRPHLAPRPAGAGAAARPAPRPGVWPPGAAARRRAGWRRRRRRPGS